MIRHQYVSVTPLTIIRVAYKIINQYTNNFIKMSFLTITYYTRFFCVNIYVFGGKAMATYP